MLELVTEIIYNITGKRDITLDTDLVKDLELTSFDVMNLICAFEERFNTTIPTRDVWNLHYVSDILDYMRERGYTEP
ncbi:MAG TPA: phosphopantetheine-binding protein [Clostridia bacterium]|nr:phosphopantetheine-binding protein [Clostridia bacterium]